MTEINPSDYRFEAPLLVMPDKAIMPDENDWQTGEAWLEFLSKNSTILGVVLPLELKRPYRQYAVGVELLDWLRWSANEPLCRVPILAAAFQPLEALLRRTLNLLLVMQGTKFVRLPEAVEQLEAFVHAVRTDKKYQWWADPADLDRLAGATGAAAGITYHTLANDYYSASRLLAGYNAALREAAGNAKGRTKKLLEAEQRRMAQVKFDWEDTKVKSRLQRPEVQQYLKSAKRRLGTPVYPEVLEGNQIIQAHVQDALSPTTRILLVDDEFDKGLAEVLLQILFRKDTFSIKREGEEWVYSELRDQIPWARFVCVRTVDQAVHWLDYWKDVKAPGENGWHFETNQNTWLAAWASFLDVSASLRPDPKDVLGLNDRCPVDVPSARPKSTNTVILLDLRLEPNEQQETYHPLKLKSTKLRSFIKQQRSPLPVIMLTASRQAMTYQAIMDEADKQADGWLTKEGPDITPEDGNSARAVHYLLQHLQESALLQGGYRYAMRWDQKWKSDYLGLLRDIQSLEKTLEHIERNSTELFKKIQDNSFRAQHKNAIGMSWADDFAGPSPTERVLVLRRVIVASLLRTTDWTDATPTTLIWNTKNLDNFLPGNEYRKDLETKNKGLEKKNHPNRKRRSESAPIYSVVINFNEKLWLKSAGPELLNMLFLEEYEWLKQQFLKRPDIYATIEEHQHRAYPDKAKIRTSNP